MDQHGKLSVIGIWRQLMLAQFPGVHPRATLVLVLRGNRTEIGQHALSFQLVAAAGTMLLDHHGQVQFIEPPAGVTEVEAPGIIQIDLPLQQPGEHAMIIGLDGREIARVPFTAVVAQGMPTGLH